MLIGWAGHEIASVEVWTLTVVEQLTVQPLVSETKAMTWCAPSANVFVNSNCTILGTTDPGRAVTKLVCTGTPSTFHTTPSGVAEPTNTFAATVAVAPYGGAHGMVSGSVQAILNMAPLRSVPF